MPRIVSWSEADGSVTGFAQRLRVDHADETVDVEDGPLADALVAAGASVGRRSLLMAIDVATPIDPGGFSGSTAAMVQDPDRYAGALLRAFPPDHPDYDPDIPDLAGARRALVSYFDGSVIGPLLDASSEATVDGGEVVGGIVLALMPADEAGPGGPWVTDVFVEPTQQGAGVGRALFARALGELRAAGESTLRLAVQIDNPARHLYDRLGFEVRSSWSRITL